MLLKYVISLSVVIANIRKFGFINIIDLYQSCYMRRVPVSTSQNPPEASFPWPLKPFPLLPLPFSRGSSCETGSMEHHI